MWPWAPFIFLIIPLHSDSMSARGEHEGDKLGEKWSELGSDEVRPGCGVCVAVGAYYDPSRS